MSAFEGDGNENGIPLAERINIQKLFAHALRQHYKEELNDKKIKHSDIAHLSSMIEEFMSAYMLIGYSLQDEQVVVINANTPKDESALADLLRSTFLEIASKRP